MPVEIKEIVIRAVIADGKHSNTTSEKGNVNQQAIVEECVHQVLKILKKQHRR